MKKIIGMAVIIIAVSISNAAQAGKGGDVQLKTSENLTISGNVILDGKLEGDGGNLELEFNNLHSNGQLSSILLSANGDGEGNGGSINVTSTGVSPLELGEFNESVRASAKGGDSGAGGLFHLSAQSDISLEENSINVNAGAGKGGSIQIETTGNLQSLSEISALGGCEYGDGGRISLKANTLEVSSINANAGSPNLCLAFHFRKDLPNKSLVEDFANGHGGQIELQESSESESKIGQFEKLEAKGRGDGDGGSVVINSAFALDLSALTENAIIVSSDGEGNGGHIKFSDVQNMPDVGFDDAFKVFGGQYLDETDDSGRIELAQILCQARNVKNFAGSEPIRWWNCDSNDTILFGDTLQHLPNDAKNQLSQRKVSFHKFANLNHALKVLPSSDIVNVSEALGFTVHKSEGAKKNRVIVYTNPFGTARTLIQQEGVLRHEIGHSVDGAYGFISESPYYKNLVEQDFVRINNYGTCYFFPSICGSLPQNTTVRDVMKTTPYGIPIFFDPVRPWREIFAEEYALALYAHYPQNPPYDNGVPLGGLNRTTDAWISYFGCSSAYANSVVTGGKNSPVIWPSGCVDPSPMIIRP